MKNFISRNISIIYILYVLDHVSLLWQGFYFIFFSALSFSAFEQGLIWGLVAFITILFEVPSGVFADRVGKKYSLLFSYFCLLISVLIMFWFSSFFMMLVAAFFFGIKIAFRSGSDVALVFDTYKDLNLEHKFSEFASKSYAYALYGATISTIIASFIAEINLRALFLISGVICIIMIILALFLVEPKKHKIIETNYVQIKLAFKEIFSKKITKYLFFFTSILSLVSAIFRYHPLFLKEIGFSTQFAGIMFAVMLFFAGLFAHLSPALVNRFGKKYLLFCSPIIIGLSYIFVGIFPVYIFGFLILFESIAAGYSRPITSPLFHKNISSKFRATISSIESFSARLVQIFFAFCLSIIVEKIGIPAIYILLGSIILIAGIFTISKVVVLKEFV
ncbi:MFS transporter [Candidatus Woesearchaeota archaeon]|nr:MFS transporter [Candidatus Woesearchaeota archaeon]MCF8012958.1 MFS transporter [Candidatus Woesearchaeota archaeon]